MNTGELKDSMHLKFFATKNYNSYLVEPFSYFSHIAI